MDKDRSKIAEAIENQSYFEQARTWYNIKYLAPISQRVFFIIVTLVAIATMFFCYSGVMNLLPLSTPLPFAYATQNIMLEHPTMHRLKEPFQHPDEALMIHYARLYVRTYHKYDRTQYKRNRRFVQRYSAAEVAAQHDKNTSMNNANSPIRLYGRGGKINVEIQQAVLDQEKQPPEAIVNFSTILLTKDGQEKTNWTARMRFEYTGLNSQNTYNETLDDYEIEMQMPDFRVISYDVRKRL